MEQDSPSFLGRYQLVKVLGTGAMGVVYEAFDPLLGRAVAVLDSHLDEMTVAQATLAHDEV